MKDQAFNGKDSISVITYFTEFKKSCSSSHTLELATVWIFRVFKNRPVIKARLTISLHDAKRHEGAIAICAERVKRVLRRYATDIVIWKDDEEIRNCE